MKLKIVGDRTSPDSVPTCDDKHKYYRKHKMSGIEHPRTQYQHVMININTTKKHKMSGIEHSRTQYQHVMINTIQS